MGVAATHIGAAATFGFLQETIPLCGPILPAGTYQIFSLDPRWSQVCNNENVEKIDLVDQIDYFDHLN